MARAQRSVRSPGPTAGRLRSDRGLAALELAILMPATLLIIFTMFQIALYWHASNVVGVAAESAVNAGQVHDAGSGDANSEATAAANAVLAAASFDGAPTVAVTFPGGDFIEVTVQAQAVRLFGVGNWQVESVARGRVEEFVPATDR